MSKKIFLDVGANTGSSIKLFRNKIDLKNEYEIHSFEPNPKFSKLIKKLGVNYYPCAAWTHDGTVTFYIKSDLGSTLFEDKITGGKGKKITVDCIDLSKFISDNFSEEDTIILKLDAEGAEYELIDKLISDGTIKYIDKLYGEWHAHKIKRYADNMTEEYIQKLAEHGLVMINWAAGSKRIG